MASSDLSSLFNQPISPPPPGVTSNLADPNSRASEVYIATGICLPFILSFAALRFYAKTTIMKKMNWDDVTCTLGLLAGISYIAIIVAGIRTITSLFSWSSMLKSGAAVSGTAYGFHLWDITLADFTKEQLLLFLIIEIIYGPCIWLIKLALFVLYLEIFGLLLWLRYLVLTGAFVSGAFYIASMIGFIVMCGPKDGQSQLSYLKALAGPECTRATQLGNAVGVFNVVSDIYLILIPLPAVWSLQMPLRKKVGASAIFLTGLIACAASIVGMVYRVAISRSTDTTWDIVNVWVSSIVEMAAGIIVCCMPTTAAVFKQIKSPISSFPMAYRRDVRAPSSSSATMNGEPVSSSANLRSIHGEHTHQRNRGSPENSIGEW